MNDNATTATNSPTRQHHSSATRAPRGKSDQLYIEEDRRNPPDVQKLADAIIELAHALSMDKNRRHE